MCERTCSASARRICEETGHCPHETDIVYGLPEDWYKGIKAHVPRSKTFESKASRFNRFGTGKATDDFINAYRDILKIEE